jgi:hypothetical protein
MVQVILMMSLHFCWAFIDLEVAINCIHVILQLLCFLFFIRDIKVTE